MNFFQISTLCLSRPWKKAACLAASRQRPLLICAAASMRTMYVCCLLPWLFSSLQRLYVVGNLLVGLFLANTFPHHVVDQAARSPKFYISKTRYNNQWLYPEKWLIWNEKKVWKYKERKNIFVIIKKKSDGIFTWERKIKYGEDS